MYDPNGETALVTGAGGAYARRHHDHPLDWPGRE